MTFRLNRFVSAIVLLASAPAVLANNVVPPPKPVVVGPATVSSLNPAVDQAQNGTTATPRLTVNMPDAPKPPAPPAAPAAELRPTAPPVPASAKTTAKSTAKSESKATPVKAEVPVDPFAGINVTPVSDSELNRFVFPEPVGGVFFQEGAPLPECPEGAGPMDPCKPVFLNGQKMMLLQLRAGAKAPFQMLVHLESGKMETMHLMPTKGPGTVVRVNGAEDGASDKRLAAGRSANGVGDQGQTVSQQNVDLLSRFARGDIPAGFEAMPVNEPVQRFSVFDVTKQASWDNDAGLKAHLFEIRGHSTAEVVVGPEMFRAPNVRALALDREVITDTAPAYLFVLESVTQE